jgi:hypothetical protein
MGAVIFCISGLETIQCTKLYRLRDYAMLHRARLISLRDRCVRWSWSGSRVAVLRHGDRSHCVEDKSELVSNCSIEAHLLTYSVECGVAVLTCQRYACELDSKCPAS